MESTDQSPADIGSWLAAANTGAGIVTMALFPFALPILLLTVAFVAPLLILGLIVALPVALVAGVVIAVRRLGRWAARARRGVHAEPGTPTVTAARTTR